MGSDVTNIAKFGYLSWFWNQGFGNGQWRKLSHLEGTMYLVSNFIIKMSGK